MFLGIDHIALSCSDLSQGVEALNANGYSVKFMETNVPNHPAKQSFLKSYNPVHALGYCQSSKGISIELTQHNSDLHDSTSFYQVLLNSLPSNCISFDQHAPPSWKDAWRSILQCKQPVSFLWQTLHAQFWYNEQSHAPMNGFIRAVMVPVMDMAIAHRFWSEGLGFQVIDNGTTVTGSKWSRLLFRALVQAWSLEVILVQGDTETHPYLDDPGFPCLALISNKLTKDKDMLSKIGICEMSDEFTLEIGGKKLNIIILRGLNNELIEIIEFCKQESK